MFTVSSWNDERDAKLRELWAGPLSAEDIAAYFGVTRGTVQVRRRVLNLPKRAKTGHHRRRALVSPGKSLYRPRGGNSDISQLARLLEGWAA